MLSVGVLLSLVTVISDGQCTVLLVMLGIFDICLPNTDTVICFLSEFLQPEAV